MINCRTLDEFITAPWRSEDEMQMLAAQLMRRLVMLWTMCQPHVNDDSSFLETKMDELSSYDWRWVVGCEGKYAVTRCGKVYSLPRSMWNGRSVGGVFLTPLNGTKYLQVALPFNGKPKRTRPIHRIVCEAFHGPQPSPHHEVAHGDGVHENNSADNLRWATRKENTEDQRIHGVLQQGELNGKSVLTDEVVSQIRKARRDGNSRKEISSMFPEIASDTLKDVLYNKTWRHIA